MGKAGVIYKITNLINKKIYIGQTTQSLNKRWTDHCSKGTTCKAISAAIHKYGKNNFKVEPILSVFHKQDLNDMETHFIKLFNSYGKNGYNLSLGGEGNGSDVLKKQVVGYNIKTGISIILNCINKANSSGHDPRSIQRCLKTQHKLHHDCLWFYVEDFNKKNLEERINQIICNKRKRKNTSSLYKGVSWASSSNKWYATIYNNGVSENLGFYLSELDAKNAYINRYKEIHSFETARS